jgi:hypothetical protein
MLKDLITVSAQGIEMQFASIGSVRRRDHIKPCNEFDFADPIAAAWCDNWSNLGLSSAWRKRRFWIQDEPERLPMVPTQAVQGKC